MPHGGMTAQNSRSITTAQSNNAVKSTPIFKYTVAILALAGAGYTGAAYYAVEDPKFRKFWIENVPGGKPALERVAVAADTIRRTDVKDVRAKASETVDLVGRKVDDARGSVLHGYDTTLNTLASAKVEAAKTYEATVNKVHETQEVAQHKLENVTAFMASLKDDAASTLETAQQKVKHAEASVRGLASDVEQTFAASKEKVVDAYESVHSAITGEPIKPKPAKGITNAKENVEAAKDKLEAGTRENAAAVREKVGGAKDKLGDSVRENAEAARLKMVAAKEKMETTARDTAHSVREEVAAVKGKLETGAKQTADVLRGKVEAATEKMEASAKQTAAFVREKLPVAKEPTETIAVPVVTRAVDAKAKAAAVGTATATKSSKPELAPVPEIVSPLPAKVPVKPESDAAAHVVVDAEPIEAGVVLISGEGPALVPAAAGPKEGTIDTKSPATTAAAVVATVKDSVASAAAAVSAEKKEAFTIESLRKSFDDVAGGFEKIPEHPVAQELALSVTSLAAVLGQLIGVAGVEGRAKLETAQKELISLKKNLNSLSKEEENLVKDALQKQAAKYAETLKEHIAVSEKALLTQADTFQNKFGRAIEDERELLISKHNADLVEKLTEQSAEFESLLTLELRKQGEELEKFWNKEVKLRIDEERGGRLARLDNLSLKVKHLERISIEAGDSLDHSKKVHKLHAAVRAVDSAINLPHQTSLTKEIALLRHVGESFPVVASVVDTISPEVVRSGVPTLFQIEHRFQSASRAVRSAQFMPVDGGPLSHLISTGLSKVTFQKKGLVNGDDVEAVLARSEYYLSNGDVENAAREMNQLTGWPKTLARDWLVSARQYLEVKQAIQVIETHINLLSLGVVQ
ncbi:Formation of crista junctions protein 1 [Thoreauomyces humboldtii]|nr:Formation of crista junctions protein 1 [Thoreauomyces humboldtii]